MDNFDFKIISHIHNIGDPQSVFKHVKSKDLVEVAERFSKYIDDIDDHCVDNYRVFPESMGNEYDSIKYQGCCGFADYTYTASSGNTYLMGFNYGH